MFIFIHTNLSEFAFDHNQTGINVLGLEDKVMPQLGQFLHQ